MAGSAGGRLKALRERHGLTARKVAELSRQVALRTGRKDHELSHTRLLQIENGESTPSIYKLFTLSVIYGTSVADLLSLYIDLNSAIRCHLELGSPNTHLIDSDPPSSEQLVDFPIDFTPAASASQTTLISELVSVWGHVPASLLAHLSIRDCRYGLIGLSDYTMYPLLRPGAFVRIEKTRKSNHRSSYSNEYDRPIFFVEHRSGYLCSWCEIHGDRLLAIPHPLSPCRTRVFAYPTNAGIVGVVTAIAVPLAQEPVEPTSAVGPHALEPAL